MRWLAAFAVAAIAACAAENADPEAEFERQLAAARDQARGSLSFFWERFAEPGEGEYDFSLKAAFPRRDGQSGVEEAWVHYIARAPDKIVGELASAPRHLGDLKKGAIMEFQEAQVVDWAFFQGDKLLGHYTTRVMLPRLDSTQADVLRGVLSSDPRGGE
ncbi:MAG: hypothetical protein B7Z40_19905 [Bosea sp. 12-68-7]|nr:MAG: hypothetical protein B7Z40_19905 [Bosea sp. 12-68-7]